MPAPTPATDIISAPLTEAQSGLWFAQWLDPKNPIFNTGQYVVMRGPLDLPAFRAAVARTNAEATALALRFHPEGGSASQICDPSLTPQLEEFDISADADAEQQALAAIYTDMATPVDPERGPLARHMLYRLGDDHHIWAMRVHHFVTDGYAMVLLTSRIAELYNLAAQGKDGIGRPFAPLADVFADDATYLASDQRAQDAAWWRDATAGAEEVVGMAPGRAQSAHRFLRVQHPLSTETREGLLHRAKAEKLAWPDVITALVAAYIRRFTGTDEVTVGMPHMGRMGSATARVPAMVMNVLPLRVLPDEEGPLGSYLAKVATDAAEARKHGRYRSEQLRRDLGLIGGARRLYGPLINVQPFDRPPRFHGLETTLTVTGTGPVEDINFTFRGDGINSLTIEVDANPHLYSDAEVQAHIVRLAAFLSVAINVERLADVPTATPEEASRELEFFNQTAHPVPDTTLTALIEQQMLATPDAEAVRFNGTSLTYRELDMRTHALACALRARGVGAEALVAVALERSLDLIIALVAVLRAGGGYLPLDLDHPAERIATILNSAKPAVILARSDPHELYGERLFRPDDWPATAEDVWTEPRADDAAYVIYTSGSTGEPKGVLVSHRAIVNRLLWMGEHYSIGSDDRILQKTPATFDVSVWEFFLPLIRGGSLVIAPPDAHKDPAAIASLIRDEAITTLHFVPSMLSAFLDAPQSADITVARVFCSGEELPADLRDRFHARVRGALHNLYGPTEAAVDVSYWPADVDDTSRPVPIGYPVWNTRLVILDAHRRPVPPGVVGQLYLGGVQLARGYVGREDLTAERFIADPWHVGERLYMTGDLARRRDDGAIVFLGRADHQIKLRGLRIELGEIEAAIATTGLTRSANVLALDGRLVAYVVPDADFTANAARAALARRLPEYMLPNAWVTLDKLPVTANGKLDRKALPAPKFETTGGDAPQGATEEMLARVFADVLDVLGPLSREDDFFALGGDSLAAVTLTQQLEEELGFSPGLAALFEAPDIAGLAQRIDRAAEGGLDLVDAGLGPIVTLVRGNPALPPLFLIHPAGGISWGYRTLASSLAPGRMVYGLQSPALDPDVALPDGIQALADSYTTLMSATAPLAPLHVAGWSVGGIIAQAVAVSLREKGARVGMVAMLDSYPADVWRDEPEPTEAQAIRALLAIAGYDPEAHPELDNRDATVAFLRKGDSPLANLPPRALDGVVRVVLDTNRLIRTHHHARYDGTITHIRAANDHKDKPQLTAALWAPYAANIDTLSVPFLHPQMTSAAASAIIGPALSARMAEAETAKEETP